MRVLVETKGSDRAFHTFEEPPGSVNNIEAGTITACQSLLVLAWLIAADDRRSIEHARSCAFELQTTWEHKEQGTQQSPSNRQYTYVELGFVTLSVPAPDETV